MAERTLRANAFYADVHGKPGKRIDANEIMAGTTVWVAFVEDGLQPLVRQVPSELAEQPLWRVGGERNRSRTSRRSSPNG